MAEAIESAIAALAQGLRTPYDWYGRPGARLDDLAREVSEELGLSAHRRLALIAAINARWPHLATATSQEG